MRLLAIGYPLPHPDIDNYNVLTAPSYFDYDALVIDPANVTRMAARILEGGEPIEAFDGRPVINGATTAAAVSAADQMHRRLTETERLLERGGVVLVMMKPNATQAGVAGFEGCDRYSWLPAPAGMSWAPPILRTAEGSQMRILDDHHPLAPLVRDFRRYAGYRAVFDARHPAYRSTGRTWLQARDGFAAGAEFEVLGGRVVFLPALGDEPGIQRSDVAEVIVLAARELLATPGAVEEPFWARTFTLPGLDEAQEAIEAARRDLENARERLEDATARRQEVSAYVGVLWADGPDFREAVRRSLVALGFEDVSERNGPLAVESDGMRAFVEIESSREEVAEWPYVRLQRRLEQHLLGRSEQLKGIVIANGYRRTPPAERRTQVTDPLRIACQNYRYALLTGETLFALVERALSGAEATELEGIRRRIVRRSGIVTTPAALGEPSDDESTVF